MNSCCWSLIKKICCCSGTLPSRWDPAYIVSAKWLPLKYCRVCFTCSTKVANICFHCIIATGFGNGDDNNKKSDFNWLLLHCNTFPHRIYGYIYNKCKDSFTYYWTISCHKLGSGAKMGSQNVKVLLGLFHPFVFFHLSNSQLPLG